MNMRRGLVGVLLAVVAACGGGDGAAGGGAGGAAGAADGGEGGLTAQQLELGVGPVTTVELGDLDATLASEGERVFALKCSACHKLNERYVGPALDHVLTRRRPEYVMNMVLNPAEMLEKHPTAKALLGQFMTPMPDQQLTEAQARAVLEYLRSAQTDTLGTGE